MTDLAHGASRWLKRSAERLLVLSGTAALARRRVSSSTLILAYHNIVPHGESAGAERSLHLPQQRFAAQLDLLARTHDVVPLTDVLRDAPRRGGRPRVAITFDDGYLGALSAGVAELRRVGLPATFFVTPGRLGGHAFWWDRLGSIEEGGVPTEVRDHALTALRGEDEAICAWAGSRLLPATAVPRCARSATEAELAAALTVSGISVSVHTWSHPNLARLEAAELESEFTRPLAWLRARWPAVLPVMAYPYGLTSPTVMAAAQSAGYEAGLLIEGGWLMPQREQAPFLLPRLNVPAGVSPDGFMLRISGLLGR